MGQLVRGITLGIVLFVHSLTLRAAEDRVDLFSGKSVAGRVQQETATEVLVQNPSGQQRVPVDRIEQIHYEGQPAALTHARTQEESGKLNQAAEEYARVQAELKDKPWVLQAAESGEARVRARLALDSRSNVAEAIERLEKFERDHPDSRHHFNLQELLGRLCLAKGDYAKATRAFDELAAAPWPEAKLKAATCHAGILRAENKLEEAIRRLDTALETKPESPEQALSYCETLLEKARCLRAMNRHSEEVEALVSAIDRAPAHASALQAEAYVELGDAHRAAGNKWDAAWAFLHVQLLFARHEELHARALYNLYQLWSELGRTERAAATQSLLRTEHPKSEWTKKLGS
jgi:tetratricopeptide (TPR) repeat protein